MLKLSRFQATIKPRAQPGKRDLKIKLLCQNDLRGCLRILPSKTKGPLKIFKASPTLCSAIGSVPGWSWKLHVNHGFSLWAWKHARSIHVQDSGWPGDWSRGIMVSSSPGKGASLSFSFLYVLYHEFSKKENHCSLNKNKILKLYPTDTFNQIVVFSKSLRALLYSRSPILRRSYCKEIYGWDL